MKNYFQRHYQKGVLLNPGRIYEEESDRYIRLSYGYASPEQMTNGIKLLSELIRKLMHNKTSFSMEEFLCILFTCTEIIKLFNLQ